MYCIICKAKKPPKRPRSRVKVVVTESRLNALRDTMAAPIRVNLVSGIQSIKDSVGMDELRKIFMSGNYEPLMKTLGPRLDDVIRKGMRDAIDKTATLTHRSMPELRNVDLATHADGVRDAWGMKGTLALDHSNPRLHKFIQNTTGNLITTSEEGLASAVKSVTARSFGTGQSIQQAAATLRGSIGLNAPQQKALNNFRDNLDPKLTASQRAAAIEAQGNKMLDYRAKMIAHTEIRNAQNMSQLEVWRQAADDGHIDKKSKKVWQVDGDPCPEWCEKMQGKAVPLDSPWRVKNTKTKQVKLCEIPSDAHPNCQCISTLRME